MTGLQLLVAVNSMLAIDRPIDQLVCTRILFLPVHDALLRQTVASSQIRDKSRHLRRSSSAFDSSTSSWSLFINFEAQ
jgi:hypothetical protein